MVEMGWGYGRIKSCGWKDNSNSQRNKEITLHLNLSPRTVKAHLTSGYNKLGADSRAAAIAIAAQKGWL